MEINKKDGFNIKESIKMKFIVKVAELMNDLQRRNCLDSKKLEELISLKLKNKKILSNCIYLPSLKVKISSSSRYDKVVLVGSVLETPFTITITPTFDPSVSYNVLVGCSCEDKTEQLKVWFNLIFLYNISYAMQGKDEA